MNSNQKYLGIDIGGTAAKLGIVSDDGIIEEQKSVSVNFDGYDTPILTTVLKESEQFLTERGISANQLSGIGVSATGGVDTKRGIIAGSAGHIKNWDGSEITARLSERFHLPVTVLNDANAAALGELWCGAAKGHRDVIVMTVGTGVGGGMISDGKILLGSSGFAGEIGHMPVQCEGEPCSCGNAGCIEHYGSTTALVRTVRKAHEDGAFPELNGKEINGKEIFTLAAAGNPQVLQILDRWMDYIASSLVGLVHIFNPELILIGGGVSAQQELFIEPLERKVKSRVMKHFANHLSLKAAGLHNDAGMIGAVYFLKNNL